MSDNPYLDPDEVMNNLSSNPFINMMTRHYSKTKPTEKKKPKPDMKTQKGPIKAKTAKKIAQKRSDIMKQIP